MKKILTKIILMILLIYLMIFQGFMTVTMVTLLIG